MKILVTGATGFIGSHLIADPGLGGHDIVCPVRKQDALPQANHIHPLPYAGLEAKSDWGEALQGCDAVIHLAARAHVMQESARDPLAEFRRINVDGTLSLARQALRQGVRRFIYVSSIGVNGEQTADHPFSAFDAPAPASPYAISKYEAECRLRDLAQDKMELVIVRPPLVYGPGVPGNFLRLMQAVRRGLPLPLGAVDNRRSLVYVNNLTDLLIACLTHPRATEQVWLVSDNHDFSTPELIRRLAEAMHARIWLAPIPPALLTAGAALLGKRAQLNKLTGSLQVDIRQTLHLLNWTPPHSAQEGISATARFFAMQQT